MARARATAGRVAVRVGALLAVLAATVGALVAAAPPVAAAEPPLPPFVQIDAGASFACAVSDAGDAYCWGDDQYGKLGDGAPADVDQPSPSPVADVGVTWAEVSAGSSHACGRTTTGAAWCWGLDASGALGNGPAVTAQQPSPSLVATPAGVTWASLSVGHGATCGVATTGDLYCWGARYGGLFGPDQYDVPTLVPGGPWSNVSLATTYHYRCAVDTAGVGYCWGDVTDGQLGTGGSLTQRRVDPTPVAAPPGVVWAEISAGTATVCGVTVDGAAHCWGWDGAGGLGNGSAITADQPAPSPVDTPAGVEWASIAPGSSSTCGRSTAGDAWCWGTGVLGTQSGSPQPSPGPIEAPAGVTWTDLTGGTNTYCGLAAGGAAYCWGQNWFGELGNGIAGVHASTPSRVSATQTITFDPIPDVAAEAAPFGISAAASSGLPVTFTAVGPCSVTGATVTVSGPGTCTITASQSGGGGWAAAVPVQRSFTIAPPVDGDGDGIADESDSCPDVANGGQEDLDGDGLGDACDADLDGDGVDNEDDAFPSDPDESADADGDGTGDGADPDDDDDGLADELDPAPLDPDADDDGDLDGADSCVTTPNADQADADGDALGNACDADDDNDGVPDHLDPFPTNPGETVDSDGDGIGNSADTDDDGDGIPDAQDAFPLQEDGPVTGGLSRLIKSNPALAPIATPLRALLLTLRL